MSEADELQGLVERLRAWGETPFEGDPMIDALLVDVPEAADRLATQQEAINELVAGLQDAVGLLEKSAKESRAADRMIYAHRAKVALLSALAKHGERE